MAHRHTIKKKGGQRKKRSDSKRSGRKSKKSRKVRGGGIGETHREVEGIPVGEEVVVASPSGVRSLSEFMAHQDREETEDI